MRKIIASRGLYELQPDQRQQWIEWLARHDLDPERMPVDQPIYCNDEERWILAIYIVLDEQGSAVFADRDAGRLEHMPVIRRLEAPALPCPPGYRVVEVKETR